MRSTRINEQNLEIISKSEDFDFSAKFCQNSVFEKSRWFSSETVEGGCDKLNKGYQNLEFFDETSNIP